MDLSQSPYITNIPSLYNMDVGSNLLNVLKLSIKFWKFYNENIWNSYRGII
jgi:hypothetical protein